MTEYTLQQKLIAEFIGTLFLTYTICLTAVWGSSGDFHPGFAIAAILMAMIYSLGYISGAHFNPAVTIGVWIRGSCEKADVLPYIATQSIAGVFGALLSGFTYTGEHPETNTTASQSHLLCSREPFQWEMFPWHRSTRLSPFLLSRWGSWVSHSRGCISHPI